MKDRCPGCGVVFQFSDPNLPGYIEEEVYIKREKPICKRCFRTKHYSDVDDIEVDSFNHYDFLKKALNRNSLFVFVIDVFDLNHTTLVELQKIVNKEPVIIIINKYDLLSQVITKEKLADYLTNYFKKLKINFNKILIHSNYNQEDIVKLKEVIIDQNKYETIYFLGASNVGKSSILNQLLKLANGTEQLLTTTNYLQTTITEIKLKVFNKTIVDTPGVLIKNSFVNYLTKKTFDKITPKKFIKPRVYQLNPKQTLFISDFVQLNFVSGSKATFVLYLENNLAVHRSKLSLADIVYPNLRKLKLLYPTNKEKMRLGNKIKRSYKITADKKQDLVFPGLGFISFVGDINLEVISYENIKIYLRDALI